MNVTHPDSPSRRAFLQRSAQLAFTGAALPTVLNLAAIGDAAAFNAPNGSYKALVCIFLYGGSDYANTVVTYDDPSHAAYSAIRTSIALPKTALAPTLLTPATALPNGRQYALHPSMPDLANLFNTGKAAVQLNVGPLIVPITKAQYNGSNRTAYPLPPKLFSHNDQQSLWQSTYPEGSTIGWGGDIGDLALSSNANSLFTCISITGNSVFLSGDSALAYQVSSGGAVKIRAATDNNVYGSANVKNVINGLLRESKNHILENEYNRVSTRAITAEIAITAAIGAGQAAEGASSTAGVGTFLPFTGGVGGVLTNNNLAAQLKMVARLIAARSTLGAKRQVFFVSAGGYDLHDDLLAGQAKNMTALNSALNAFYQTTVNLGVADKVTSFTASDFGRTLTSNGDGSDHGWGSHHIVVGGAVKGKEFYGYAPPVSVGNTAIAEDQWHVGQGRLLPTASVDQYAATLATWFGVNPVPPNAGALSELDTILPNLRNFGGTVGSISYPKNLGFMLAP
jgi:uncharacterized protein (DUF1501 family)